MRAAFPDLGPELYEKRHTMSRICELTGKRPPQVGHNVSHANNKTKRGVFCLKSAERDTDERISSIAASSSALSTHGLRSDRNTMAGWTTGCSRPATEKLSANALKVKRELVKSQAAA